MITVAVTEGEEEPDMFFMDMKGIPWDGSAGATLTAAWYGGGMTAMQSHAFNFQDFPATRSTWPGALQQIPNAGGWASCMFTTVAVGVVETAIKTARQQLLNKRDPIRDYEQTEWARVEVGGWMIQQV
jgi:hypothetical protein